MHRQWWHWRRWTPCPCLRSDGRDPVMPGASRRQAGVGVSGGGGARVGHQVAPGGAVGRDFYPVASNGRATIIRRRDPRQIDLSLAVRRGRQRGRRRCRCRSGRSRECRRPGAVPGDVNRPHLHVVLRTSCQSGDGVLQGAGATPGILHDLSNWRRPCWERRCGCGAGRTRLWPSRRRPLGRSTTLPGSSPGELSIGWTTSRSAAVGLVGVR